LTPRFCIPSGGAFDLPEGSIYPALYRLEGERLLHSRWEVHQGRRRCVYGLTAAGRRALAEKKHEWTAFVHP
jgi:DNA-binding PadR family transcriptional regulator